MVAEDQAFVSRLTDVLLDPFMLMLPGRGIFPGSSGEDVSIEVIRQGLEGINCSGEEKESIQYSCDNAIIDERPACRSPLNNSDV